MGLTITIRETGKETAVMPKYIADRRLYMTADQQAAVEEGDARAAYVLCGPGSTIGPEAVARLGLSQDAEGRIVLPGAAPATPPPPATADEVLRGLTRDLTVAESTEALEAILTLEELALVREGELAHPEHTGGRKGVLAAIEARAEQLAPPPA